MYRVILGTDGSKAALKAAAYAAGLLRHGPETTVSVVYVRPRLPAAVGPAAGPPAGSLEMADEVAQAERELLRRSSEPFEQAGIPVTWRVETGQPGSRLCTLAAEEGVDLLVIGSRGHSELKALLLGSVSSAVVHGAPCPVLVVH